MNQTWGFGKLFVYVFSNNYIVALDVYDVFLDGAENVFLTISNYLSQDTINVLLLLVIFGA